MKNWPLILLLVIIGTASANAADWNGKGWYQIKYITGSDGGAGKGIYAGPFADRKECKKTLPEDEDDDRSETWYECEYLKERGDF